MRLFGGKKHVGPVTKLYFCSDLHGSEACFRKFLSAGPAYSTDVVIMGGDCTGKMLVPIVALGDGTYRCKYLSDDPFPAEELEAAERGLMDQGLYPRTVDPEGMERLQSDEEFAMGEFRIAMKQTLERWMQLADTRLADKGVSAFAMPGNDDEFVLDEVFEHANLVQASEGRIVRIDDSHEMLSIGWSNPTPWDTHRETSEEELLAKIVALADQLEEPEKAIFNIHVPPFDSGLDLAPALDDGAVAQNKDVVAPVGSTAVRETIERYEPLLSLHGHVHESRGVQRIGRTTCINPGSVYTEGVLQGAIVDLGDEEVVRYALTTG